MRNGLTWLDWQILMTRRRSRPVLYSVKDAGVRDENLHPACTWFFRAKDRLEPAKTWKDVLHFRGNCQKECIDVASDITCACSDIIRPDLGTALIEHNQGTALIIFLVTSYRCLCLGSFPRNTVTRRSSLSCHAEKIQHSNK